MPFLKTERLTVVPYTLELVKATMRDKEELGRLLSARVPANFPGDYEQLLPSQVQILEKDPTWCEWSGNIIIHTEDQTLIGTMGFKERPDREGTVEIGYGLIPEYWGHGYATEMAKELIDWAFKQGVKRITAECLTDNIVSIRVLEKLGMRRLETIGNMIKWEIRK